ncbi:MAG: DUF2203 domain-containing protein [Gammaproteobacteria bacterium]|nr:DUF2203 domain-containing protein [Gammaproteobacteria bacterium]MDH3411039.1 DUF2203 domain-containing protein [Gammaproteobacteria bacterium]
MTHRYFTVSEANKMIPELESRFGRMLQLHAQIRAAYDRLENVGFAPEEEDFEIAPENADPEVTQDLAELRTLMNALRTDLEALHREGCIVKDIGSGLVDWYAQKDGREVFLCWKLGEKSVNFWHELESGFDGRQPVSEL